MDGCRHLHSNFFFQLTLNLPGDWCLKLKMCFVIVKAANISSSFSSTGPFPHHFNFISNINCSFSFTHFRYKMSKVKHMNLTFNISLLGLYSQSFASPFLGHLSLVDVLFCLSIDSRPLWPQWLLSNTQSLAICILYRFRVYSDTFTSHSSCRFK